jgi:hypothetical protein
MSSADDRQLGRSGPSGVRFDVVWNRQLTWVWQLWCACWSHGPIGEAVWDRGD